MASYHPTRCRVCGIHRDFAHISKRGYCPQHGDDALVRAAREIAQESGPAYDAWLAGLSAAIGKVGRPITPYPPDA